MLVLSLILTQVGYFSLTVEPGQCFRAVRYEEGVFCINFLVIRSLLCILVLSESS